MDAAKGIVLASVRLKPHERTTHLSRLYVRPADKAILRKNGVTPAPKAGPQK